MIEIRELFERTDLEEAVRLQKHIWGFEEIDLLPLRLFVVATKVGGQVLGAFDGDRMVGFAIAIPGIKAGGRAYLHSHMAGVVTEYRNQGIGRMLKLRQRSDAMARGIGLIEWTFDPLELKNAFFNIERLGVVIRRFVLNQYGQTSSQLHGGLPTDRCVAEWHLSSPRVGAIVGGLACARYDEVDRIAVPNEIAAWRHSDPERARDVQREVSSQFIEKLSAGLAVIGFEKTDTHGTYILGRWDSQ